MTHKQQSVIHRVRDVLAPDLADFVPALPEEVLKSILDTDRSPHTIPLTHLREMWNMICISICQMVGMAGALAFHWCGH